MGRMQCPFLTRLQNQVGRHAPLSSSLSSTIMVLFYGNLHFGVQLFVDILERLSSSCLCVVSDESGLDEGAAKTNPSLTREKDLVVNISDLDNIFDEDDEELGVRHHCLCLCVIFIHLWKTNSNM